MRTAPDGHAALAEACAGGVDLVITDLLVPGLDGWALCHALRQDSRTVRLPIIALSIVASSRGHEPEADAVVGKPFTWSALRTTLERFLHGPEGAAAREETPQ